MMIEFVGSSRKDTDNPTAATSELMNCYREPYEGGHVLKSVPGMASFADLSSVFLEALAEIEDVLWAVSGGVLYEVSSGGTTTSRGAVLTGNASLAGNNGTVCVVAGGDYFTWNGTALATPATPAFDSIGSVTFLGQRTVVTELGGRRFAWSGVADAATFGGLDFATAEGTDNDLIRGLAINGALWLFTGESTEIWQASGTGFEPIGLGVLETGLKAFGLITKYRNGAFLVGSDNIVYRTAGTVLEPISFPAVETDIAQGTPTHCLYYEDEGHKFCVIRFSDRPAWVWDISVGEWHRRAYGTDLGAWPARFSANVYGGWKVGDSGGALHTLGRTNTDEAEPLLRRARSRTAKGEATAGFVELFGNVGQFATEPFVMTRFSKDRGRTWGAVKHRSWGALGDYRKRVRIPGPGWARNLTMEVAWSGTEDVQIEAQAEVA